MKLPTSLFLTKPALSRGTDRERSPWEWHDKNYYRVEAAIEEAYPLNTQRNSIEN